jgi:predicted ArsR family transcriptional regulator
VVPDRTPASPTGPGDSGEEIDADDFTARVSALTSAFGDRTRREIYLFARATHEGVTASEVAEHFELHANVARHHLEKLTSGGYLDVDSTVASGSRPAGRPSKRYLVPDRDADLAFPPRRDDVLASLLAHALDRLGPEQAEALADEVGFEYGRSLAARMGPAESHRSVRSALATVADALTAHGFAAHTDAGDEGLAIVSECCPFGAAAEAYPHVVCAVDRGMIRGMLASLYGETEPHFAERRPDGDDHCVTRV